ncbi:mediator of RNA polymerase II transcription subunit 23-like [Gigantopelta aegis]|uniref:mediator of RNA polymerase II transcription subunit 23-like n=1 Tax=Gigantopelta aegis TaxID=1735272 RepID=UPI001B88E304|nr:mediator of RNA polymerase II transcription subunit 23-like [Gigantopelta aegis]
MVKIWDVNNEVYIHINKITKSGTKQLSFSGPAFRTLMEHREEILAAINQLEHEVQEESEMLSLAVTDERLDQQQQLQHQQHYQHPPMERVPLHSTRRFQPYVGTGLGVPQPLEQARGVHTVGRGHRANPLAALQHHQQQQQSQQHPEQQNRYIDISPPPSVTFIE